MNTLQLKWNGQWYTPNGRSVEAAVYGGCIINGLLIRDLLRAGF